MGCLIGTHGSRRGDRYHTLHLWSAVITPLHRWGCHILHAAAGDVPFVITPIHPWGCLILGEFLVVRNQVITPYFVGLPDRSGADGRARLSNNEEP